MKAFLFLTFIFVSLSLKAQICIRLESISIGCVPSVDHPCFKNKNPEVEGSNGGKCKFFPEGAFLPPGPAPAGSDPFYDKIIAAQAGPIAFSCQTWEPAGPCPPGGDVSSCPRSKCLIFHQPVCRNNCEWCIKEYKEEENRAAGCIVCTRPYCEPPKPDPETPAGPYCPLHPLKADGSGFDLDYTLPKRGFPKCASMNPTPCPRLASPPETGATCLGPPMENGQCVVDTGSDPECQPRQKVDKVEQPPPPPPHCPWITDQRSYIPAVVGPPRIEENNVCEPVEPGNRFPGDCCKCNGNKPIKVEGKPDVPCSGCGPLPASVICT